MFHRSHFYNRVLRFILVVVGKLKKSFQSDGLSHTSRQYYKELKPMTLSTEICCLMIVYTSNYTTMLTWFISTRPFTSSRF